MSRYLLVGDIHLSDRPPSSCTDSYLDDIFDLLEETSEIASYRHVKSIIWAGDIFHHKTPGRTSHRTVRRLIDYCANAPVPIHIVPGNHDMQHDRIDSIDETQPLGVLLASGQAQLLAGWMSEGDRVFGVPWLMTFDDETVRRALKPIRAAQGYRLVVTHAPLYPLGKELEYEFYPADRWADAMANTGSVYYGHVHEPHGLHRAGGVVFCNPGALSRGSLHEHNLQRRVSCALWDSETGKFEIVEIPHRPASEVFRLAEAQKKKSAEIQLDNFLKSVGETRLDVTSVESVVAHVNELDIDDSVKRVVKELLSEVEN